MKTILYLFIFFLLIGDNRPEYFVIQQINSSVLLEYQGSTTNATILNSRYLLFNYHLSHGFKKNDSMVVYIKQNTIKIPVDIVVEDSIHDLVITQFPQSIIDNTIHIHDLFLKNQSPQVNDMFFGYRSFTDSLLFSQAYYSMTTCHEETTFKKKSHELVLQDTISKLGMCGTLMASKNSFGITHAAFMDNKKKIKIIPGPVVLELLQKVKSTE